ncbi:MAG: hypothetical protein U0X39_00635 [Bacteroidales bacterium]
MKRLFYILSSVLVIALLTSSCGDKTVKPREIKAPEVATVPEGSILAGKDIITEVFTRPDTLGDPWEVEKVSGYSGTKAIEMLLSDIYDGKLTVYDCLTGEALAPDKIKEIRDEVKGKTGDIAKLIFTEDWYYVPARAQFEKRVKNISFGLEIKREEGLPPAYKPLFMVKYE